MTTITDLPNVPDNIDGSEMLPAVSPRVGGAVKITVRQIGAHVAKDVVSNLKSVPPVWDVAENETHVANGKLLAHVTTVGLTRTVTISLTIGSTTVPGNGAWAFALPSGLDENAAVSSIGVARARNGGQLSIGIAEIKAGENTIQVESSAGIWGAIKPNTWAAGDTLDISITYRLAE